MSRGLGSGQGYGYKMGSHNPIGGVIGDNFGEPRGPAMFRAQLEEEKPVKQKHVSSLP